MTKKSDGPTTSAPRTLRKPRNLRRWLIILGVFVAITAIGIVSFESYKRIRQERVITRARSFLENQDDGQALMSLRRALQVNPHDVEANRMMADLAEKAGVKEAVQWRRIVTEVQPGVLKNQLAWANAALRFNEPTLAEQALAGVAPADRSDPSFLHLSGRVALAFGQVDRAQDLLGQAVQKDPANAEYQFDLDILRLTKGEESARAAVERAQSNPEFRTAASRALFQDAIRRNDSGTALAIGRSLQSEPGAPFQDKILYLGLLRQLRSREFDRYLLDLQEEAAANPAKIAAIVTWLNRNSLALLAVDWCKALPTEIQRAQPVAPAYAESQANLKNWAAVKELVTEGDWQELDYMRLALSARVLKEEGNSLASKNAWNAAVKAAGNRPEALANLVRFARASKWDTDALDLLWLAAKAQGNPQWALAELTREYSQQLNARALLSVATRTMEVDPNDLIAKNNVAALSLLLNVNVENAQALAEESYKQSPKTPGIIATYAYAKHLQADSQTALELMKGLPTKILEQPSYAAYYGVILAGADAPEQAGRYLELAAKGRLLPEELELVTNTRRNIERLRSEPVSFARP